MVLFNLGRQRLFEGPERARLDAFRASLSEAESRRFVSVAWKQMLEAIEGAPKWLRDYLAEKDLD